MKKIIPMLLISSICCLSFASENQNEEIPIIDKVQIKNDMGGMDATFEVEFDGIKKELKPNKKVTIFDATKETHNACTENRYNEFMCKIIMYYDGMPKKFEFEPTKKIYKISDLVGDDS